MSRPLSGAHRAPAVAVAALVVAGMSAAPLPLLYAEEPAEGLLYGRAVAFAQPKSPWDDQWQLFKANVAKDETIDLDYFVHGERGGEEQMMHDIRRGRAHLGGMSLQGLSSTIPELTVAMAPYIFSSTAEVDYVYDEFLLDFFNELFAEKGLMILQWVEVGWTNLYTNGEPVVRPADARGMKLRGSPNVAARYFLEALDADSIPLSSADLVPALQTGLINGGLSSTVFHFFVTRRYSTDFTLTRHSYDTGAVVVHKAWFDAASESQRETLRNAWPPSEEARAAVRNLVQFALDTMREEGIAIHELDENELARWRAATQDVTPRIIANVGGRAQAAYEAIERGKRAFTDAAATRAAGAGGSAAGIDGPRATGETSR